jgi:hypothetical protein
LPENHRADALDSLLFFATDEPSRDAIRAQLRALGRTSASDTVYSNSQNIHNDEIEARVASILLWLQRQVGLADVSAITPASVADALSEALELEIRDVGEVLERILHDSKEYHGRFTLRAVFFLVAMYAEKQPDGLAEQLRRRIAEELREMRDTCSTGYLIRLLNTLTGFTPISIGFSVFEEMYAKFVHRIEQWVRETEGGDALVIEALETESCAKSKTKEMYRSWYTRVHGELYQEYVGRGVFVDGVEGGKRIDGIISEAEFDETFRRVLLRYDGVAFDIV